MELVLHALGLCGEHHINLFSVAGVVTILVRYRKLIVLKIKNMYNGF